jgi:chemotaxis protein MotB
MSATGYADTKPLLPRTDPRAVVVDRRVEIVVLASMDDAQGRAIAALGNADGGTASGAAGSGGAVDALGSGGTGDGAAAARQQHRRGDG